MQRLLPFFVRSLGWFKNTLSSQTEKLMAASNFSDYLGIKHYKKAKKNKTFHPFSFGLSASKFQYIPSGLTILYYLRWIWGHQLKKVCSSDVMHFQIGIFELKMMVKIGAIFKSYLPFQRYSWLYPPKDCRSYKIIWP